MKKELSALVIGLTGAKADKDLSKFLSEHGSTFTAMGWEIPDLNGIKVKRQEIVQAAFAAIAGRTFPSLDEHGKEKGAKVSRASKPKTEDVWTVTIRDEKGKVVSYLAEVWDAEQGKTVTVQKEYIKGFDALHRAESWLKRILLEKCGPGSYAEARTSSSAPALRFMEGDYLRDEMNSKGVWGDTRRTMATHKRKVTAPKRGGEMKVAQSVAKFSRG